MTVATLQLSADTSQMVFDPFHWVFQEEKERKGRDYGRIM
jgi:hypothetical protein